MNTKLRRRYTADFKAQAVELMGTGKAVTEIAEELCIGNNLLYEWKQEAQGPPSGHEGLAAAGDLEAWLDFFLAGVEATALGPSIPPAALSPCSTMTLDALRQRPILSLPQLCQLNAMTFLTR